MIRSAGVLFFLKKSLLKVWRFPNLDYICHMFNTNTSNIMTGFTAIYACPISLKMEYFFKAQDLEAAKRYASWKFGVKELKLRNEDTGEITEIKDNKPC